MLVRELIAILSNCNPAAHVVMSYAGDNEAEIVDEVQPVTWRRFRHLKNAGHVYGNCDPRKRNAICLLPAESDQ